MEILYNVFEDKSFTKAFDEQTGDPWNYPGKFDAGSFTNIVYGSNVNVSNTEIEHVELDQHIVGHTVIFVNIVQIEAFERDGGYGCIATLRICNVPIS